MTIIILIISYSFVYLPVHNCLQIPRFCDEFEQLEPAEGVSVRYHGFSHGGSYQSFVKLK